MGIRRASPIRAAGAQASPPQPTSITPSAPQPTAGQGPADPDKSAAAGTPRRQHRWRWWLLGALLGGLALIGAVFYYLWHIPLPGPPPLPQASVVYDAN